MQHWLDLAKTVVKQIKGKFDIKTIHFVIFSLRKNNIKKIGQNEDFDPYFYISFLYQFLYECFLYL